MSSTPKNQKNILSRSIEGRRRYLWLVLSFLALALLAACNVRALGFKGTCEDQTKQFLADVRSLVIDDLNPVIVDGFKVGPTADVMKRLDEVNSKAYALDTLQCNPGTKHVKDELLLYLLETKNYFNVVAGRIVYGEGSVQAQLSKMSEAGLDFEIAYDDLRR